MFRYLPHVIWVAAWSTGLVGQLVPSLGTWIHYVPEILSIAMGGILTVRLAVDRSWILIPPLNIICFAGFALVCLFGLVLNAVDPLTAVAGIRALFLSIPFFLAPFVFKYSRRETHFSLGLILVFLLIQVPITYFQRFSMYSALTDSDLISGTLRDTSMFPILCASAIVFLTAMFIDRKIRAIPFIALCVVIILPAIFGETKATPLFIALGVAVVLFGRRRQLPVGRLVFISVAMAGLLGVFAVIYSSIYTNAADGKGYLETFDSSKRYHLKDIQIAPLQLNRKEQTDQVGRKSDYLAGRAAGEEFGRFNTLQAPIAALYPNAKIYLLTGLGIGNVTSQLQGGGQYYEEGVRYYASRTTISHLLWETGLIGAALILAIFCSIALRLVVRTRATDADGTFQLGLAASVVIVVAGFFYANVLYFPAVLYPLVFLAGQATFQSRATVIEQKHGQAYSNRIELAPVLK